MTDVHYMRREFHGICLRKKEITASRRDIHADKAARERNTLGRASNAFSTGCCVPCFGQRGGLSGFLRQEISSRVCLLCPITYVVLLWATFALACNPPATAIFCGAFVGQSAGARTLGR